MNGEKEYLKNLYMDIEIAIQQIMEDPRQHNLEELRGCINKFFPDSQCLNVIYTPNTDKLFFGIYVFPKLTGDEVVDILFHNNRYLVKQYWVELDSKMFNGSLMLTPREITALLIHDIAHMVNTVAPAEIVKTEISKYLSSTNDVLKISNSIHYRGILAYGFADAMRKYTTIFEQDHYVPESTDDFIYWLDFQDDIRSAFYKLNQMWANYNREVRNKFITLSWVLRIYKDIKHNRIPALEGIKRCIELSPSKIEQQELKNFGARISRIDDDSLLESSVEALALRNLTSILEAHSLNTNVRINQEKEQDANLLQSVRESILNHPRHQYRSSNLLEAVNEDIDRMIFNNQSYNEPDAMPDLLNCINQKMACIKDYADNTEMSKEEFAQWSEAFDRLDKKRKEISQGLLYSESPRLINTYNRFGDQ